MALEEIAIADIRKGQKLLVINEQLSSGKPYLVPSIFTTESDGRGWNPAGRGTYYLLADIPTPPQFKVPWGTAQRSRSGNIWEFYKDSETADGVIAKVNGNGHTLESAAAYAPFTRLYTVQELIEQYKEFGYRDMVRSLLEDIEDGLI